MVVSVLAVAVLTGFEAFAGHVQFQRNGSAQYVEQAEPEHSGVGRLDYSVFELPDPVDLEQKPVLVVYFLSLAELWRDSFQRHPSMQSVVVKLEQKEAIHPKGIADTS